MERQVVGDEPEVVGDGRVLEEMAPLQTVGASGVLQQQRHALAGFFVVDAMIQTVELHVDISPGGGIVFARV